MANSTTKTVSLRLAATGHRRVMYFNRFSVTLLGPHRLVYFGLVQDAGNKCIELDRYCAIMTQHLITKLRPVFESYISKMVSIHMADRPPDWQPSENLPPDSPTSMESAIVDNEIGEIVLFSFSLGMASNAVRSESSKAIEPDPLALLRSDPNVQLHLLAEIFKKTAP